MSVKMGILALLEQQAAYGYQLKQEFETHTGGTWPVNVGQVYTTLERLERDGLVRRDGADGEGHVMFSITPKGQGEVAAWLSTASAAPSAERSELAVKIALASVLPQVDVQAVIQIHRKAALARLQEVTRAKRADTADLMGELVLEAMAFRAEADVRWLDHADQRILRARRETSADATNGANA